MTHTLRGVPGLWTVGYYAPDYEWTAISDHKSIDAAKAEVSYLNGGPPPGMGENVARIADALDRLADCILMVPDGGGTKVPEFVVRVSEL